MTEDPDPRPDGSVLAAPGAEPGDLAAPEVRFVVPAPAYESIATDDGDGAGPLDVEPDAPEPSGSPLLGAIAALGEDLGRKLDALQARLDRETRAEATREKVVDRLHAELQEYKQGLLLGILRPVFVDLIQLHDDMGKILAAPPPGHGDGESEAARLLDLIRGLQDGVGDILYRQGVEPFALEGVAFDPRRQRALSTVPTDDPALNKQVAGRVRKGFQAGDKVIRPEMVTVHSFKEKPSPASDPH